MKRKIVYSIVCVTLWVNQVFAQDTLRWDLAQSIDYAIRNNITVKQSELNQQTAENNLVQSRFSRLPSLSATGSNSLTRGTSIDPITSDFVSQTINSTSVGLNSQVTLFSGNKINNTIKQNQLTLDQNSLYVKEAQNNITLQLTEAYLMALYYKEGIATAEETLKLAENQLKRSQALHDAGSLSLSDLSTVKSTYASNNYTLVTAKNAYVQQVLSLKQLLELEPEQILSLTFPEEDNALTVVVPDKYEVYYTALESMPQISAGETGVSISQLAVKVAKASYYPTLSLSGNLSTGYTNTQNLAFEEQFNNNFNQRIGLSLSIPIFNNYQTKRNVQNAVISTRTTELNLIATKKELYQKIENAHQNAVAAQAQLEAAQIETEASLAALDLAKQRFELGAINAVDMQVAQNTFVSAQQKYLQAKYTGILYYQLLQFYQGNPIKI